MDYTNDYLDTIPLESLHDLNIDKDILYNYLLTSYTNNKYNYAELFYFLTDEGPGTQLTSTVQQILLYMASKNTNSKIIYTFILKWNKLNKESSKIDSYKIFINNNLVLLDMFRLNLKNGIASLFEYALGVSEKRLREVILLIQYEYPSINNVLYDYLNGCPVKSRNVGVIQPGRPRNRSYISFNRTIVEDIIIVLNIDISTINLSEHIRYSVDDVNRCIQNTRYSNRRWIKVEDNV